MSDWRSRLPDDPEAARAALYDGVIYHLGATAASRALVTQVQALLETELGPSPRDAATHLGPEELFTRLGRVRRTLFLDRVFHIAVARVIDGAGFDRQRIAFDPIRLRVVASGGHRNPRAAPVYYPHRDTWYAHPQAVIAWWIPLDDLPADQTFVFHPERFRREVPNGSERFDYQGWVADGWDLKIGWQDREAGRTADYPGVLGEIDPGPASGFACRRADNLLFAGAQFHRTLPHDAGRTRFSLDFRIVDLDDHARGLGAPNADNRSRGSAVDDYVRAGELP